MQDQNANESLREHLKQIAALLSSSHKEAVTRASESANRTLVSLSTTYIQIAVALAGLTGLFLTSSQPDVLVEVNISMSMILALLSMPFGAYQMLSDHKFFLRVREEHSKLYDGYLKGYISLPRDGGAKLRETAKEEEGVLATSVMVSSDIALHMQGLILASSIVLAVTQFV